jgi:hypothetical protein
MPWCSATDRLQIPVEEIDCFGEVKAVSPHDVLELLDDDECLPVSEAVIKDAFQAIIGEAFSRGDWAGEEEDLYSTRIAITGRRTPAALLLKGPGNQKSRRDGALTVANCNVNGDQIQRLFQSPAELFIIQYVGPIHSGLIKYARDKVEQKRHKGERATVCFIDGQDTARILKAFGRLPADQKGR